MSGAVAAPIDPRRLAEWLGHGVTAGLLARFMEYPRLQARCIRLIDGRVGQAAASAVQEVALSLDGLCLAALAHRSGAVWHAIAILRPIEGAAVRGLIGVLGPGLRRLALAHAGLAPNLPEPTPLQALPQAIADDGLRCLIAWCDAQPGAVGLRVALRLNSYATPGASHRQAGPAIVEALLRPQENPAG